MKLTQLRVDGYKNLVNCVVELGGFNVLVGPNNSGKSNLLEAVQMFFPICFGSDEIRRGVLVEGLTPPPRVGSWVCHLPKHRDRPLTMGVTFEMTLGRASWKVDYDVTIRHGDRKKEAGGFISECMTAKDTQRPGPPKRYMRRQGKELEVLGRRHAISKDNPALLALRSLYPDFVGLPPEMEQFFFAMNWIALTRVLALSPKGLREDIDSEKFMDYIQVTSFDILLAVEKVKEEGKHYQLFIDALCDILELEGVDFAVRNVSPATDKKTKKESSKRVRLFLIRRKGDISSLIEEYSDGTLALAGILAALLSKDTSGPILCLEELENCLHPAAVEKLLRFLQDHSDEWPVLITTHSPYVLNGVHPEDVNVAVVDPSGATHFEKVKNSKQLRDYLNKGLMSFGELLVKDFEGFREG